MGNYYDKKSTGGRTTSKIENQDSVAAIYALEQLHSTDIFLPLSPYFYIEYFLNNISKKSRTICFIC